MGRSSGLPFRKGVMKFESLDEVIITESVLYVVQECTWPALKAEQLDKCLKRVRWLKEQCSKARSELEKPEEEEPKENADK